MTRFIAMILASVVLFSVIFTPGRSFAANSNSSSCSFACIGDSLSQVFPFDIFSGIPQGAELKCPQFTIFSRSFEFCLFVDAIRALKYPVIIGLLIKVYLFS